MESWVGLMSFYLIWCILIIDLVGVTCLLIRILKLAIGAAQLMSVQLLSGLK